MGLLTALRLNREATASNLIPFPTVTTGIRSPFTEGHREQFVFTDVFGADNLPVTRKEAMSVPAYAKGRNVIVGMIAPKPLRELDRVGLLAQQPAWLYRTDAGMPPLHRMAQTVDDLIWYGHSLWAVERGTAAQILDATRVAMDRWRVQEGVIELLFGADKWVPAEAEQVLYIPGIVEGLISNASESIRGAKNLERSWVDRAANPIPLTELHLTEEGIEQEEIDMWLKHWRALRQQRGGATGSTPHNIELKTHGDVKIELFTEGRNFARLDAAAFLNISGVALDASLSESSLTYTTTEGAEVVLKERMPFWTSPIEARLSMDDVCVRGHRIRFDFSDDPTTAGTQTAPYEED